MKRLHSHESSVERSVRPAAQVTDLSLITSLVNSGPEARLRPGESSPEEAASTSSLCSS